MRGLRLWLDDEREVPAGWIRARNAREAILCLRTGQVSEASLDHETGLRQPAYQVLAWLEERCARPGFDLPRLQMHSANAPGRARMQAAIESIGRVHAGSQHLGLPEARLATLPHRELEEVIGSARDVAGPHLCAVILYGSRAWGSAREDSDIDLAFVVEDEAFEPALERALRKVVWNLHFEDSGIEPTVIPRGRLRRLGVLEKSFEGKVLRRGLRLDGELASDAGGFLLTAEEARHALVSSEFAAARHWVQAIQSFIRQRPTYMAGPSATELLYMSACRALRALLLAHGVDATERKLRWVLPNLAVLVPLLTDLGPVPVEALEKLPWHFYTRDYGLQLDRPRKATEVREACVAAAAIIELAARGAERALGARLAKR